MAFEETVKGLKTENGFFSPQVPIYISRAPGRLDLMGGNDDYTGGLVFESTIREATYAAAQIRLDELIELKNKTAAEAGWTGDVTLSLSQLSDEVAVRKLVNKSSDVRWTAYVLGNIYYLRKKYPGKVHAGINVYMESNVPLNRGVSSSAAIEIAVMKAAAAAYGIDLSGSELALACQWVENTIAESACGIMDQMAVVMGKQGFIMPMVCQPCNPEPLIRLPNELKIWGIDSGVSHQISGVEYEAARAAAFMGYKIICDHLKIPVTREESSDIHRYTDPIWNGYLANLSCADFYEKFESLLPAQCNQADYLKKHKIHVDPFTSLRENITYHVWANTKYAVEENQRVRLFSELSRGAAANPSERAFQLMGELMYQSHYAYTECGLGSKATDYIVDLCKKEGIENGILGAKITGGGAGGTVAILAKKNAGNIIEKIMGKYAKEGMGNAYLFKGSSDGADSFGVLTIN
jgi:L-arabinokinase